MTERRVEEPGKAGPDAAAGDRRRDRRPGRGAVAGPAGPARPGRHRRRGHRRLVRRVGGPAEAAAAAAPGPGHAAAGAATAAPRPRPRDGIRAVAAVGKAGRGPPRPPVPPVPAPPRAPAAPVADLGARGPRPLRARPAGPGGGARPVYSAAAGREDRGAGRDHRPPSGPGGGHQHPRGPVRADRGGPREPRAGVRVQPAAAGRGALDHAVGRAGRVRRPGHRDPPRPAAVRDGRVQGRGGGLLGRRDRAVAADAAARRGAAAGQHGPGALLGAVPGPRGVPARPARRGRGSRAVGHADPRPDDLDRDQDHRHHPVHGRGEPGVHARPGAARGGHARARARSARRTSSATAAPCT